MGIMRKDKIVIVEEQKDLVKGEVERVNRRLRLRMDDLKYSQRRMAEEGDRLSRIARFIRYAVVTLGVIVALKAGLEQLMITYQFGEGIQMTIDLSMFAVGAAISLLTGIEGVRKFGERGSAMRELSGRSFSLTRGYMSRIDKAINITETLNDIDDEMNNQLEQIYKDAEKLGIDLSIGNPVDYSVIEAG